MAAPRRALLGLTICSSIFCVTPSMVMAQDTTAAAKASADAPPQLWSDFVHYVRIAQVNLALESGKALLATSDNQLLDVIEQSEVTDYDATLLRAARIEPLKDTATALLAKIQAARIARIREPDRIGADILRLAEGSRANANATNRLRAAGQYAAPQLLATLLNPQQKKLQPYVLAAMVAVGRPMVAPLSAALPKLEPLPRTQVAQVLAEIGYPLSLPYLKLVLEEPKIDPAARTVIQSAFDKLVPSSGLPADVTAADLFLTLGQNVYATSTRNPSGTDLPGFDPAKDKGILWDYTRATGLVPIPLAGPIFGDVLAMRAAKQALELRPTLDPALTLWLSANLRRKNRLAALGTEKDPSYAAELLEPQYYLELAGPMRQREVLDRALDDGDTKLALDAITALADTSGGASLNKGGSTVQPLLRALSYPDRRVRFASAFAAAAAAPQVEFPGSHRVVPVLSEAVRQSEKRYALVLAGDDATVNQLRASLRDLNYQTIGGSSLAAVTDEVNSGPGVDLIVTRISADNVDLLRRQTAAHYKLAAVPILALSTAADQIELDRRLGSQGRVHVTTIGTDAASIKTAVEEAAKSYRGDEVSPAEADQFAAASLDLLKQIAASRTKVYNVFDAKPALLQSIVDKRQNIAISAASVLALMDDVDAQRTIADAALDATQSDEKLRIALLGSLADSAAAFGNRLTPAHMEKLLELVKTSQDKLALASARAHGALTPPTSNLVQMIVK